MRARYELRGFSLGCRPFLTTLLFLFLLGLATTAFGQERREWISPDQSPEDTAPSIVLQQGGPDQASFHVEIHGYWQGQKSGPDGNTYITFDIPGAGFIGQTGAPMLPAIQFPLAIPSDAPEGGSLLTEALDPVNVVELGSYLVWPQPIPERDDEEGTPEIFQRDEDIYSGQDIWPGNDGPVSVSMVPTASPVPHATAWVYPFHWDPTTGNLQLIQSFVVLFVVEAPTGEYPEVSPWREKAARNMFCNWEAVRDFFPVDFYFFHGRFLLIYPQAFKSALQPLIDQKKARGFLVTELTTESIGSSCGQFRSSIYSWYSSGGSTIFDDYCLLVGDDDIIPLCDSPSLAYSGPVPTEDLYASPIGDDLAEEVYLGRLSVNSSSELDNQVSKILNYENSRNLSWNYLKVGLVAHKQGAPGKYQGAHESVRTAFYTKTPEFVTLYGSLGATDADVSGLINEGAGIVAYRGHGSTSAWTGWNTSGQYYNATDINALNNAPRTPIIWSIACSNMDLRVSDCVGESWMSRLGDGAAAFYGATVPSWTGQNHELDRALFRAVFNYGMTSISHAIESAEEEKALNVGSENAWMYGLLGDPDLTIRTTRDAHLVVMAPEALTACTEPPCYLELLVKDEEGIPVHHVLVSAWKPAPNGKAPSEEVFDNAYTDAEGRVLLRADASEGPLQFWARDVDGNEDDGTVDYVTGTGVGGPLDTRFFLRANPSVMTSRTTFDVGRMADQKLTLTIFDLRGRQVRSLNVPAGVQQVQWDGKDAAGMHVASGVYLARMVVNNTVYRTRVTMLR